jgi:glycine/D-amino acid oxidase-like deaminating enzyme
VIHDAHGWWLAEAGPVEAVPPLAGELTADVVVVGGGYAGLWTAWHLLERGASVAVLEAELCGHGPSGRNGGFCETLWTNLPDLVDRFGEERALVAASASSDSVTAIGAWCEEQGVDAWFRRRGFLFASTSEAQDAVLDRLMEAARAAGVAGGDGPAGRAAGVAGADRVASGAAVAGGSAAGGNGSAPRLVALDAAAARARCASPRFRRAVFAPDDATVHPARLALGLRARVIQRGAKVFERSRVKALRVGSEVVAETAGGSVRAGAAVLAVNAAARGIAPLRRRLAVSSSHIVLTEPVPDALEQLGWTGGESVTDARTFLHYFRTTNDHRVVFGWGGGRLAAGARLKGRIEVDPEIAATTRRHLDELLPTLAGRKVTHAWGGPIDVSPSHLPQIGALDGAPVHFVLGFTGNGVGPSHLAGRILAARATGEQPDAELPGADPVPVPPEPIAWAGGMLVRAAFLRRERIESEGGRPGLLTRAVTAAPRALGIHVGR